MKRRNAFASFVAVPLLAIAGFVLGTSTHAATTHVKTGVSAGLALNSVFKEQSSGLGATQLHEKALCTTLECDLFRLSAVANSETSAAFGVLKGLNFADAAKISTYGGTIRAQSSFLAEAQDSFVVSSPGLTGQLGLLSVRATFQWELPVSLLPGLGLPGVATAKADTFVRISAGSASDSGAFSADQTGPTSSFLHGVAVPFTFSFQLNVPFVFGVDRVQVEMRLLGEAAAIVGPAASGFATAWVVGDRSTYWDGIAAVTYQGASVPYSLVSDSGTDWSQSFVPSPVPEPNSGLLLFFGATATVLLSRARTKTVSNVLAKSKA